MFFEKPRGKKNGKHRSDCHNCQQCRQRVRLGNAHADNAGGYRHPDDHPDPRLPTVQVRVLDEKTIGGIFTNKHITAHTAKEDRSISQFQSLCTALAATIGTGNISGVAAAIATGGPGSVFWMWIVAVFGMMTNYSENVLGIYYRRKNEDGEWCGGAMYYLKDGLGSYPGYKKIGSVLAVLFSCFCILASFGIGNMGQINSIAVNMTEAFHIPAWVTGVCLMAVAALVVLGGIKRIAAVTESWFRSWRWPI